MVEVQSLNLEVRCAWPKAGDEVGDERVFVPDDPGVRELFGDRNGEGAPSGAQFDDPVAWLQG
ncbi:MAG: hypothetical protein CME19_04840 [Gemmatimonadetes bacterium]|nr:hypothetical protein [Gemmatimonadota bacterium]